MARIDVISTHVFIKLTITLDTIVTSLSLRNTPSSSPGRGLLTFNVSIVSFLSKCISKYRVLLAFLVLQ